MMYSKLDSKSLSFKVYQEKARKLIKRLNKLPKSSKLHYLAGAIEHELKQPEDTFDCNKALSTLENIEAKLANEAKSDAKKSSPLVEVKEPFTRSIKKLYSKLENVKVNEKAGGLELSASLPLDTKPSILKRLPNALKADLEATLILKFDDYESFKSSVRTSSKFSQSKDAYLISITFKLKS